jgi:phage replication O-like protein O
MANVVAMKLEQPLAEYNGKPEIDDGHTKIANELLDAIIGHDFSKRQLKILLLIMRKTYGWNKSEDDIARSQITEATGLANPHVTTALQELQAANVLIITQGKYAKRYKINKYYDQWRVTNLVTITETVTVTETVIITETVTEDYQNGNNSLPKQYPQKTTPKDNTKDICFECLNYLNEKANRNYKPVKSNLDFIKARLKEGFTKDEIFHVINVKVSQWLNDVAMNQYLRPATLFNATKFAQYAAEQPMSKAEEVPEWKRGML